MTNPSELPRQNELDQAETAIENLGRIAGVLRDSLIASGFTKKQTRRLVEIWRVGAVSLSNGRRLE